MTPPVSNQNQPSVHGLNNAPQLSDNAPAASIQSVMPLGKSLQTLNSLLGAINSNNQSLSRITAKRPAVVSNSTGSRKKLSARSPAASLVSTTKGVNSAPGLFEVIDSQLASLEQTERKAQVVFPVDVNDYLKNELDTIFSKDNAEDNHRGFFTKKNHNGDAEFIFCGDGIPSTATVGNVGNVGPAATSGHSRSLEEVKLHLLLEKQFEIAQRNDGLSTPPIAAMPAPATNKTNSPTRLTKLDSSLLLIQKKRARDAVEKIAFASYGEKLVETEVTEENLLTSAQEEAVLVAKENQPTVASPRPAKTPAELKKLEARGESNRRHQDAELTRLNATPAWAKWRSDNQVELVKNSPKGTNNCLLLALLQHASGRYGPEAHEEQLAISKRIREKMVREKRSDLPVSEFLPAFDRGVKWAVEQINAIYGRDLRVVVFNLSSEPGEDGTEKVLPLITDDWKKGSEPVAIYCTHNHFEALITSEKPVTS
jgi:hypothetical protein